MGRVMGLRLEAAGQMRQGNKRSRGGTRCRRAAVRRCWPAACYLLQRWLTSRRGVSKVGQRIICLHPLFFASVTSSSRSPWLYQTSNSPHNLPSFVSPVVPLSRPRLFSLLCFPKLVFSFFARMYFLLSTTRSALSHLSPDHWRICVVFRTQPDWESEGMRGKEGRNGWR